MADNEALIQDEVQFPSTSTSNQGLEPRQSSSLENFPLSHPNHILQKLMALTLMCVIGLGSYFCYDNPAALQDYFIRDMSLSTSDFVLLYSWYSWPNAILCFVGGFLMDRIFGIRLGTFIYALLVVLGQLIFAYGAFMNAFWLTIAGRFIFGVGGESLAVAQNSYAVVWFKGKELNMVFGFQLSIARVGSTINFWLMEPLYKYISQYYTGYQCLGITLLMASLSCIFSVLSSVILGVQDKHAERILNRKQNEDEDVVKVSDVKYFPLSFWLTTFTIVFYYSAIFPFVALGKVFFERKFNLDPGYANFVNSILYIISAVLAPFFGLIIDRYGRNLTLVFGSLLVTIFGHMLLAFTFTDPLISMCIVGVAYSMMASALWPLIALVIPDRLLGTAYGIAQSFENLGLGIIQLVAGIIVDKKGYYYLEAYFISCLCVALLMVIIMWLHDVNNTGYLNMSIHQRFIFDQQNRSLTRISEKEKLLDSDYGSVSDDEVAVKACVTFHKDDDTNVSPDSKHSLS